MNPLAWYKLEIQLDSFMAVFLVFPVNYFLSLVSRQLERIDRSPQIEIVLLCSNKYTEIT